MATELSELYLRVRAVLVLDETRGTVISAAAFSSSWGMPSRSSSSERLASASTESSSVVLSGLERSGSIESSSNKSSSSSSSRISSAATCAAAFLVSSVVLLSTCSLATFSCFFLLLVVFLVAAFFVVAFLAGALAFLVSFFEDSTSSVSKVVFLLAFEEVLATLDPLVTVESNCVLYSASNYYIKVLPRSKGGIFETFELFYQGIRTYPTKAQRSAKNAPAITSRGK